MATTTTKLALTKPEGTDLVDISVLNTNFDKIDSASGVTICTSTSRPGSPFNGQIILETDTLNQRIWLTSSSTWVLTSGTPVGAVISIPKNTAPTGWLLCDGTVYSNITYPDLSAYIGNTFGGISGTSFAVPDLRGRVPVGKNTGTFGSLGAVGGLESVTLDITQIPSHNHGGTTSTDGAHTHTYSSPFNNGVSAANGTSWNIWGGGQSYTTGSSGSHSHTITSQGGGLAHTNLQPYVVLNYAIKL